MIQELFDEEDEPVTTQLVSIRKKKDGTRERYDVRIDRRTIWGNPYSHLPATAAKYLTATREEAIEKYREYILSRPDLLVRLGELEGKILGCWCVPAIWKFGDSFRANYVCHGQVLIELIYEIHERHKRNKTD